MSTGATVGAALIGSGALTGIITWLAGRNQSEATTASVLGDAARALVEPMRAEIGRLEAHVQRLTEQVAALLVETESCHRDRDADRARLGAMEIELARYKAGPDANYDRPPTP